MSDWPSYVPRLFLSHTMNRKFRTKANLGRSIKNRNYMVVFLTESSKFHISNCDQSTHKKNKHPQIFIFQRFSVDIYIAIFQIFFNQLIGSQMTSSPILLCFKLLPSSTSYFLSYYIVFLSHYTVFHFYVFFMWPWFIKWFLPPTPQLFFSSWPN